MAFALLAALAPAVLPSLALAKAADWEARFSSPEAARTGMALLQLQQKSWSSGLAEDPALGGSGQSCSELVNHGSHFTIDIAVGTPEQTFSVVADTGSDTLIVASCLCRSSGYCESSDRCFTGTNKSTTFDLPHGAQGPQQLMIAFGSGVIEGVLAKDTVRVGQLTTQMQRGLMLMTAKALSFSGPFEGILGLGPPRPNATAKGTGLADDDQGEVMFSETADLDNGLAPEASGAAAAAGISKQGLQRAKSIMTYSPAPDGFLEQAGVDRFSLCFNDGASGVLRLQPPAAPQEHVNVGIEHWGLDFRGVSVGDKQVPLSICSPHHMKKGQQSPCGAIPDSGTTLITAPGEHLEALLTGLCDSWPRCQRNYSALATATRQAKGVLDSSYGFDPFGLESASKSSVFKYLLSDCDAWLDKDTGIAELPSLFFHVAGNGTTQQLELPPYAYVLEDSVNPDDMEKKQEAVATAARTSSLVGGGPATGAHPPSAAGNQSAGNHTLAKKRVCMPAFSKMDYVTERNGPVWIFGTPFFYEYIVGYSLQKASSTISFRSTAAVPCGSCDRATGLLSASVAQSRQRREPRPFSGVTRGPNVDTARPL